MNKTNEIYKVSEKTYIGKRVNNGECGITYYKEYGDALKDFLNRMNRMREFYGEPREVLQEGEKDLYCTFEPNVYDITYHFRLEKHDIY